MIKFNLNGKTVNTDVPTDTPLLWVIRDEFGLKGTKFGCGIAMCGACTVHVDGDAVRACSMPVGMVASKDVKTIEGFEGKHPLQQAWVEEQVPQCGYCQSQHHGTVTLFGWSLRFNLFCQLYCIGL